MKIFKVKKLTESYIAKTGAAEQCLGKDLPLVSFMTRKDLSFDREEVVLDAIIEHNRDHTVIAKHLDYRGYSNAVINLVFSMVRMGGWTVFERGEWLLVVRDRDITVL